MVAPPIFGSPGKTKVAFPIKVHNNPQSLQLFEDSLADQLNPGIEELRIDLALRDAEMDRALAPETTMDELGAKVPMLLGQALEVAERTLTNKDPKARPP